MTDSVRVLDPIDDRAAVPPLRAPPAAGWPRLLTVGIVLASMVVVWAGIGAPTARPLSARVEAATASRAAADDAAETGPAVTSATSERASATLTEPEPALPGVPLLPQASAAEALGAFEAFVRAVNGGDARAVTSLLVVELPGLHGVGTSEWPLLPTDAALWVDGTLDRRRVQGFVDYLSALSGTVHLSPCESWGGGPKALLATCPYETSGGLIEALGGSPESGHLHGVMVGGRVAGMFRHGEIDMEPWHRLVEWTGLTHPERVETLGRLETRWVLDPVYTADAALAHAAFAAEMLAAMPETGAGAAGGAVPDPTQPEEVRSISGIVR